MSLKLYYDLMSQPSRALYILLKSVQYPFEQKPLDLRKGAHFSDEFTSVNRLQRVPVIDHNGFVLAESVAILKYLVKEKIVPESLYPQETKAEARVQEFLEWQHIGLRLHLSMYFRVKYLDPIIMKTTPDQQKVAAQEARMVHALEDLETKWLGRGHQFLTGDKITVADLLAACEVEQPRMAGYDARDHFPNVAAWMSSVRDHFNPHYDDAHIILNKVVKKYNSMQQASKL